MVTMRELVKNELNKGFSQRRLADKMRVSLGTIQNILFSDTTKFTLETRKKIADYFHVPFAQFLDDNMDAQEAPVRQPNDSSDSVFRMLVMLQEDCRDMKKEIKELKERLFQPEGKKTKKVSKVSAGILPAAVNNKVAGGSGQQ